MIGSEFDIVKMLESVVGYKGLPFPGLWFPSRPFGGKTTDGYTGDDFQATGRVEPLKTRSNKGTALYKKDLQGKYYFMPVVFMHEGKEYEIDCALVSVTGKKNIIETPLVGRKGSVKELISIDDYQVNITGVVIGNREWPEEKLEAINELYNVNSAIELKCALTDVFFSENDKVVIQELNIPRMSQVEYAQVIEIKCVTDRAFELILD